MKYAHLIWRNLQRNRRRTILTIAAIAVAVFVYSMLAALPSLVNFVLGGGASARRIITHSKSGVFYTLPEAHLRKVREVPHIDAAVAFTFFGGIYRDPWAQLGFAIDPDRTREVWPDWGITAESAAEFIRIRTAALASPNIMRRYGWHVGQQIMLRGTIYPVDVSLQIVGELGGRVPPDTLLMRRDYLNELLGGTSPVNAVWALADRTESLDGVIAAIDRQFANSAGETQSESESSFVEAFANVRSIFNVINALAGIVVFTIALVAANTAVMAIRERRGEIAVMRAIGFGPFLILGIVLAESILVGLLGGLVGCAAAYIVQIALPAATLTFGPVDLLSIPTRVVLQGFAVAIAIGVASGIVPAVTSMRANIVASLRAVA